MKIELCEDNGFLNDGKPSLVVLVIDGKHRIPYEATKTIQELYQDARKIVSKDIPNIMPPTERPILFKEPLLKNDEIQREDIVKCVKKHERDPGADDDLVLGNEYRVIDIGKKNNVVKYYEVLDDSSGNKHRIPVFPDEVELVRKHVPGPPRKQVFEIIKKCGCNESVALELNGDTYMGQCPKCGCHIQEARPVSV